MSWDRWSPKPIYRISSEQIEFLEKIFPETGPDIDSDVLDKIYVEVEGDDSLVLDFDMDIDNWAFIEDEEQNFIYLDTNNLPELPKEIANQLKKIVA